MTRQPSIKHVKRANMWCVTYWKKNRQQQEWFPTKKEANNFITNNYENETKIILQ